MCVVSPTLPSHVSTLTRKLSVVSTTHPDSDLKTIVPVSVTILGIRFQNGKTMNAKMTKAMQVRTAINTASVLTKSVSFKNDYIVSILDFLNW